MFYEISVGSVTRAHRAVYILKSHGISATVIKSRIKNKGGCSFAIKVKSDSIGTVLSILTNNGIEYYGVDKI